MNRGEFSWKKPRKSEALTCLRCRKEQGVDGIKVRRCGRCSRATYCGKECQTADWPKHKEYCRAIVTHMREVEEKEAQVISSSLGQVVPISRAALSKELYQYVEIYRNGLSMTSVCALGLPSNPFSGRHAKDCFTVEFSYHPQERKLNKRIQYRSSKINSLEWLYKDNPELYQKREKCEKAARDEGAIGYVLIVTILEAYSIRITEVTQCNFGMQVMGLADMEAGWEENLKTLLAA